MAKRVFKSKLFNQLSAQEKKVFHVRTSHSTKAGVRVENRGGKKGSQLDILVPSTTIDGTPRTVKVSLTGRQARALYATLNRFYSENPSA